jgi:hypothetical protein
LKLARTVVSLDQPFTHSLGYCILHVLVVQTCCLRCVALRVEKLWGLKLGQRLKDIRLKGAYLKGKSGSKRKAQLNTLGFVWEPRKQKQPGSKRDAAVIPAE